MSLLLGLGGTGYTPINYTRTTADTVATLTEATSYGPSTWHRTASANATPITEAVIRVGSRTRFYLPSTGTSPVSPGFQTWTETTGADRLRSVLTRSFTGMTDKVRAHTATAAGSTFLSRLYVSDPIAAQTIPAGTIKGTIRVFESAINDNLDSMVLAVYVCSNDGTTYRSPAIYGPANGTIAEFNTILRAKRLAVGGATSAVTASQGDRIVIHIGTRNSTVGVSLSDTINYGDNSATDLGDNETDTSAFNPFVEINKEITFTSVYVRSAGATIDAIGEAANKVAAHARTVAQTYGAFGADTAVAIATPPPPTFIRNAGQNDGLVVLTETVSRTVTRSLTTSTSLGAISEYTENIKGIVRTSSATVASLAESLALAGAALHRTVAAALSGYVWGQDLWGAGAYGGTGITTSVVGTVFTGIVRTVAQTLGAISETTSRLGTFARAVPDAIGTLAESTSRVLGLTRSTSATIATLTETIARGASTFGRAVADTVGAITEAVVAIRSGANNYVATVADSLSTLTESVVRVFGSVRTVAQTLGAISETVSRGVVAFARTVAESLGSISELVSQGGLTVVRAVADTVGAISEVIVRLGTAVRTVAQSVGAISETTSRLTANIRAAFDSLGSIVESVGETGSSFVRSTAQSLGAIVESIANGAQVVGGIPPVIGSALHAVARVLGHSPKPSQTAKHDKPRVD